MTTLVVGDIVRISKRHLAYLSQRAGYHKAEFEVIAVGPTPRTAACGCRPAERTADCAYCGCGGDGIRICGRCAEAGIDGPVISGTMARRCATHAAEDARLNPGWVRVRQVGRPGAGTSIWPMDQLRKVR